VARYTLDADRDTWILDHSIDEVPVLPGVIGCGDDGGGGDDGPARSALRRRGAGAL
jgi:hypothetical protein